MTYKCPHCGKITEWPVGWALVPVISESGEEKVLYFCPAWISEHCKEFGRSEQVEEEIEGGKIWPSRS